MNWSTLILFSLGKNSMPFEGKFLTCKLFVLHKIYMWPLSIYSDIPNENKKSVLKVEWVFASR